MRVVIWGAGQAGEHLLSQIKERADDISVESFIDGNPKSEYIADIPVRKPDEVIGILQPDAYFLAAGSQKANMDMVNTLTSRGITNIYMLHDIAGKNRLKVFDENGNINPHMLRKIRFDKNKPTLVYFEMPIVDNCNLNCNGCVFGINNSAERAFVPFETVRNDLLRMHELFYDIPWIRILGGEPTLHPQLMDILSTARRIFPDSEIDLTTNGLLIPSMSDDDISSLERNKITIHISGYKPVYGMMDRIKEKLDNTAINYTIIKRDKFFKFYRKDNEADVSSIEVSHKACPTRGCPELYKGKMMKCSALFAFDHFNREFGTKYEINENKELVNIHSDNVTGWDVKELIDNPIPLCRYCDTKNLEWFEWHNGKKENLGDYIISLV